MPGRGERLRRPEKPKPTPEAREQASRLHAHANTLKSEVASIIEKDILPKIDSIVAAYSQAAILEFTTSNFIMTGYLNELKRAFDSYQNAVVMGRRPLPAASDVAGNQN